MTSSPTGPFYARALILDADAVFAHSLASFLQQEGYPVQTAADEAAALSELQAGQIELLLVDLHGLNLSAADFLPRVMQATPAVVVVVITGHGSIEDAVSATRLGAFDYLTKPIIDDEIRTVLARACRQQAILAENRSLKSELDSRPDLKPIVGHDPRMRQLFTLMGTMASARATVLISGESGTGKSIIAREIHRQSPRRDKPFVEISCGALPDSLLESELFGHARGAFTGAAADRAGKFSAADGGTLFLDEINSASLAMQVKLLRVLQDRSFEPVGSNRSKTVDVRMILASNGDLNRQISAGTFRQDLFYRINVLTLHLPPLRDRPDDIPLLAGTFLRRLARENQRAIHAISPAAMAALRQHRWPGNVRELENAIERAVVLCRESVIQLEDLPETLQSPAAPTHHPMPNIPGALPLARAMELPERELILASLQRHGGSRKKTAAELGINRTTLFKKMRKFGLLNGPTSPFPLPAPADPQQMLRGA